MPSKYGLRWAVGPGLLLLGTFACGPGLVLRPVEIELIGLVSAADRLILRVADPALIPRCEELTARNALTVDAARTVEWRRSDDAPRQLELEGIELAMIRFLAVALDASNAPIQFGCADYAYADLERPEVEIVLEPVP